MSLLSKIFGKKKKEFIPANPHDDSKAARVYDEEEKNVPYTQTQMRALPKGLTPNKFFSKHSVWNSQMSSFIPRSRYNEPVAIKARDRRKYATLKNA